MTERSWTIKEIWDQFAAWEAALQRVRMTREPLGDRLQREKYSDFIFTGCGSSYYSSLTAAGGFQSLTGWMARGVPASEIALFPDTWMTRNGRSLLVTISRSGETSETIQAVKVFRERNLGEVLAVTCYEDSTLCQLADVSMVAHEAKERSVVQTKSFTTMLLLLQSLALTVVGNPSLWEQLARTPAEGEKTLVKSDRVMKELAQDLEVKNFIFLGSGPNYGLACEAMLKTKEMSLSPAEVFHFLEFRHGPKSTVDEGTLVVGLTSEAAETQELHVLEEVRKQGAKTLVFGGSASERSADYFVQLSHEVPEFARGMLAIPPVQLLALYRAEYKGLNPDAPPHLDPVVILRFEEA